MTKSKHHSFFRGSFFIATVGMLLATTTSSFSIARDAESDLEETTYDLRIAAGEPGKGFSNMLRDINKVCGSEVRLQDVKTDGSFTNISLLANNQADIGMATIDILGNLKQTDENIAALQVVFPLNLNLLHVVAKAGGTEARYIRKGESKFGGLMKADDVVEVRKEVITKFSDLKGKKVVLVGSARITGPLLERALGYGMKFSDADIDEDAIKQVLENKAHAYITISGYPNGKLSALKSNSGLSMVPYDLSANPPYVVIRKNYVNMGVVNNPFLAVPSVLLTRPYKTGGDLGRKVVALQSCMNRNLDRLKEGGPSWKPAPQPGWAEVKNTSESYGWPLYNAGATKVKK